MRQLKGIRYPNLFIVGAMRCGTTSWFNYLGEHPKIFKPIQKGGGYFHNPQSRSLKKSLKEMYAGWNEEKYAISAAHYFQEENSAKNIKEKVPNAKIIISIRDRNEILKSHYEFSQKSEDPKKRVSFNQWKQNNPLLVRDSDYKNNIKF
jgi:hypothetical protein